LEICRDIKLFEDYNIYSAQLINIKILSIITIKKTQIYSQYTNMSEDYKKIFAQANEKE
jgi:hypothetical protein